MRLGTIGGGLLVGSCLLLVVMCAIAAAGGSVGLGSSGSPAVGGLVLLGAIGLAALGIGILALAGPAPLQGRGLRIGFGLLSVGLLSISASTLIASTLSHDPLESGPVVILFFLGAPAILIGAPLTILALLFRPGRLRRLGLVFLGGLLLAIVTGMIRSGLSANGSVPWSPIDVLATATTLVGAGAMLFAVAQIGLTAMDGRADGTAVPA